MDLIPLVFSSGWASGVNAYLAVLVLGLSERFGSFSELPDALGRTDVLLIATVMAVIEFVADKVPYVDSTWDAISTVIRPAIGTALALLVSGDATSVEQAGYAVLGGGTALASHAVKAGGRLAINTSPEPFTNVVASVGEDIAVVGVVLLAIRHPWIAGTICLVLLIIGAVLLRLLLKVVRRGWRRWKGRPEPAA
ncbi:DUF4126 domain-containing protein [Nocardioides marmoriginsengisoli]|uniref:DUF4126 domain-containing protein n=1 Tax=Nocardioides marmoriginsengisoli TaxID=661483 RepID=A0A3N0CNH1_9ACTN|nr:DUF4126 domain-containing protein [Nocardioides marmoriginsengisoli]RNL65017.1 DUF4126 domain-containing protein [Nocardioides marmoriginsengisoli]